MSSTPRPLITPDDPSSQVSYPPVIAEDIAYVEIFPPIGIARVGNSGSQNGVRDLKNPIEAYLAPEMPRAMPKVTEKFRDNQLRVKRQAVRFRLYAYDENDQVLGEINTGNGYQLQWTVDVANTKAAATIFKGRLEAPTTALRNPDVQAELPEHLRSNLIIKPLDNVVVSDPNTSIPLIGKFTGSRDPNDGVDIDLGEVLADQHGRLIFIGGSGFAQCVTKEALYNPDAEYPTQPEITSEFDNVDWADSTCDGWVSVKYSYGTSGAWKKARHNAYVISAPPDYSRGVRAATTLWDTIEDIYNENSQSFVADPVVQFERDIWPVLFSTYQISWLNNDAFQGHGPNGSGNFLPLKDKLGDTSSQNKQLREHIFNRIRMPDYLNKDQASMKWMPRLSGDAGDMIRAGTIKLARTYPNAIAQFASLTSLQYDRFKRWKNGQFGGGAFPALVAAAGTSVAPAKIEDVPLHLQPEYLTRAHLENTVGDPLYPGIEVYWIAKTVDAYDLFADANTLSPPFRINPGLRPGDMTKGCSLPWQSDFAQCNTHWWPSSRPDDVVTKSHDSVKSELTDMKHAGNFVDSLNQFPRKRWTRLMRPTPLNDSQFFPGCTDMVRWWDQLGFVRRFEFDGMPPFYIETDRLLREPREDEEPGI